MCGICGLIDLNDQSGLDLYKVTYQMAERLTHRGPDAEGFWHEPGIALGHRRLSIIDLVGSSQPMIDSSGRYVLVFNGEIYNYVELRSELMSRGTCFTTKGDTEVLLAAYVAYGPACLDRLNGMFAFVIWDRAEQSLFAARDRMGVKPFFYGLGARGLLAFASELQALRSLPLDFDICSTALTHYLTHGFIRSPNTIFQNIYELRPAHYLYYTRKGLSIKRYWEIPLPDRSLEEQSTDDLASELRDLFRSAVHLRLRSDVPLGAFLSGGLDSSAVVAGMKDLGETAIHTFAIGFDGISFDESPYAERVAKYFRTEHHESHITSKIEDILFDLVRHYGQPFGDSSAIPTWHLCKETRHCVTVALSGDGGDELFCGYRRYLARHLLNWYRLIPSQIRHNRSISKILDHFSEGTAYYDHSLLKKIKLFMALDKRVSKNPNDIYPAYFAEEELQLLLNSTLPEGFHGKSDHIYMCREVGLGEIDMMMRADLLHYLPDDILTKVDRASMAHGLEVRSPFMDYRIVEFAARLPLQHKLRGLTTKYILRKAFSSDLPSEPIKRPKHGFAVPLGDGFHGPFRDLYGDIVLSQNQSCLVNKREAERLFSEHLSGRMDHGHKLWLLLFLHAWLLWWRNG